MGSKIAISTIMSNVRTRGEWRSTWLTGAELLGYVNDSIAALQDFVLAIDPWQDDLIKNADVSFSSGNERVSFPDDCYRVYGVSIKDGTAPDGYRVLEQASFEERYSDGYENSGSKSALRWREAGDKCYLIPRPNFSGQLRIEYAYAFPRYTDTSTQLDFVNSWHEWVVIDVCIKCCAKEESDPSVYMAQRKDVETRIAAGTKQERDIKNAPKTVSTSTNLQSLRRSVRGRGKWDVEKITDAQLTDWINSSVDSFEDFILSVDPTHSSMLSLKDITVTSGIGMYTIPSGVHTIYGVSVYDSTYPDEYKVLEQFRWDERYADGTENAGKATTRWIRYGSSIRLQPIPNWTGSIRLEYAKSFQTLAYPTDALDFENSWNEWVILDVCSKCAISTQTAPDVFVGQQKLLQERITATLKTKELITLIPKSTSTSNSLMDLRRAVRNRGSWLRNDITDAQLTEWINASIRAIIDMEIMICPEMFNTIADIHVVSGTSSYNLPVRLYRLTGVSVANSDNPEGFTNIERVPFDERYDYSLLGTEKFDTRYIVLAGKIELLPTPNWTDTLRISYVISPLSLSNPTDTFDFKNGWQEWVILDVCCKVSAMKKEDPQVFMVMRGEVEERIKKCMMTDMNKCRTIVDVHRRWSSPRYGYFVRW